MQVEKTPPYYAVRDRIKALVPASLKPPLRRLEKRATIFRYRGRGGPFLDPERDSGAVRRRLLRLSDAAERGVGWAWGELQTGSISTPGDLLSACHKGVWALAAAGRPEQARTLLRRLAREVSIDGDLLPTGVKTQHSIYPQSCVAIGAHEVGERGLFASLSGSVAAAQDPRTGGFWSQPAGHSERYIDSVSTSIGGLVLLRRGDQASAERAAEALGSILRSQPAPLKVFFTTMSGDGKLITDPSLPTFRAVHVGSPGQKWFPLGLASLFLTELYERSGEAAHLELAVAHMDSFRRGKARDRFFLSDAGKTAAAAGALYRVTRNKRYARIALSISAFIAGSQHPNGRWSSRRPGSGKPVVDVQRTLEYVLWLRLVTGSLAVVPDVALDGGEVRG
jgi:hypothetical protein